MPEELVTESGSGVARRHTEHGGESAWIVRFRIAQPRVATIGWDASAPPGAYRSLKPPNDLRIASAKRSLSGHALSMTTDDSVFQLGEAWFALGVVTPECLASLRAEWERGEDRNPEHYRWCAFVAFLAQRRPLGPPLAGALYELGERDPDQAMGSSMMDTIVQLPECPEQVLRAAAASGRRHLVRLVERRRADQSSTGPHPDPAV